MKRQTFLITVLAVAGIVLPTMGQTPIAVRYTATTDNVGRSDSIRIELFRWSTDEEREQLLAAWKTPAAPAAPVAPAVPEPEPAAAGAAQDPPDATAAPPTGRGAGANARGGGAARGGANARGGAANTRGAARGGAAPRGRGDAPAADAAPPRTPESSLAAALGKATVVGRLWSSESAGYSLRYAFRMPQQDGGERIILISDRRLNPDFWKPSSGAATNYDFSLIEARLNSKGTGEGKASLTGKVTLDDAAKSFALENYPALPVIFKNVERR